MIMLDDFKKFAIRGNVLDLAIGVIIGGAFSNIVTSLVNDIIMPAVGLLLGRIDFSSLAVKVGDATIHYGLFINNVIDFLIVSFSIYIVVKRVNRLTGKKDEPAKKKCRYCCSEIDIHAVRCPHCTSMLDEK